MITIKDIARAAGVSHTTVSRALRSDSRIPPATTQRIVKLAKEMGYVPNSIAQSLSSQRTDTIGMLVPSIADPVIMDCVEGVENAAQDSGYSVFISTSHDNHARELRVLETFQRRRVDGIILAASRTENQYKQVFDKIKVPLVLLDSEEIDGNHPGVSVDNVGGAALVMEHLLAMGHRRIGYIGASDRPLSSTRRLRAYTHALEAAGVEVDPGWIFNADVADDIQRGQLGLAHCLAAGVSALFCYNDQIAIGALNSCYRKGISVPADLSVVGFDDIRAASYVIPPLTTVRQPLQEMGKKAMNMLLALLNENPVQNEKLACEFVPRASVAAPVVNPGN